MKKRIFIVMCTFLIVVGAILCFEPKVRFNKIDGGSVKFVYGGKNVQEDLTDEHIMLIVRAFKNKRLSQQLPSCGFTEDVSIKIENKTFCIACDTCPMVYLLEADGYFELDKQEYDQIRDILSEYGFIFPCI